MIFRYEKLWLPLLAENHHDHLQIAAPLDIAWIWHCHMLSPVAYARDCNKLYGEILSHTILVGSQITEKRRKAEVLWHQKWPGMILHFRSNWIDITLLKDNNGLDDIYKMQTIQFVKVLKKDTWLKNLPLQYIPLHYIIL